VKSLDKYLKGIKQLNRRGMISKLPIKGCQINEAAEKLA
jgi:hypothetical protein